MKVGLITGASRGLGWALASELSGRGWHLIVDGRDRHALDRSAAELGAGAAITPVAGNVADPHHRKELADAVRRAGKLDLLVNNASTLGPTPLLKLDGYPIAALEEVFRVNTFAPLALIQEMLPLMSPGAAIVNITSDAAVEPYEGWGGYGSSKAALEQLTAILGAERPDLSVYAFDPGDMRTQMQQDAFPGEDISDRAEPGDVVPSLMRLLNERPASGKHTHSDLSRVTVGSRA